MPSDEKYFISIFMFSSRNISFHNELRRFSQDFSNAASARNEKLFSRNYYSVSRSEQKLFFLPLLFLICILSKLYSQSHSTRLNSSLSLYDIEHKNYLPYLSPLKTRIIVIVDVCYKHYTISRTVLSSQHDAE
jgi:hypothetical protein